MGPIVDFTIAHVNCCTRFLIVCKNFVQQVNKLVYILVTVIVNPIPLFYGTRECTSYKIVTVFVLVEAVIVPIVVSENWT